MPSQIVFVDKDIITEQRFDFYDNAKNNPIPLISRDCVGDGIFDRLLIAELPAHGMIVGWDGRKLGITRLIDPNATDTLLMQVNWIDQISIDDVKVIEVCGRDIVAVGTDSVTMFLRIENDELKIFCQLDHGAQYISSNFSGTFVSLVDAGGKCSTFSFRGNGYKSVLELEKIVCSSLCGNILFSVTANSLMVHELGTGPSVRFHGVCESEVLVFCKAISPLEVFVVMDEEEDTYSIGCIRFSPGYQQISYCSRYCGSIYIDGKSETPVKFMAKHLKSWDIILLFCSRSSDIRILSCIDSIWKAAEPDPDFSIPILQTSDTEQYPLGFAIEYSYSKEIGHGTEKYPPQPLLVIQSSFGFLYLISIRSVSTFGTQNAYIAPTLPQKLQFEVPKDLTESISNSPITKSPFTLINSNKHDGNGISRLNSLKKLSPLFEKEKVFPPNKRSIEYRSKSTDPSRLDSGKNFSDFPEADNRVFSNPHRVVVENSLNVNDAKSLKRVTDYIEYVEVEEETEKTVLKIQEIPKPKGKVDDFLYMDYGDKIPVYVDIGTLLDERISDYSKKIQNNFNIIKDLHRSLAEKMHYTKLTNDIPIINQAEELAKIRNQQQVFAGLIEQVNEVKLELTNTTLDMESSRLKLKQLQVPYRNRKEMLRKIPLSEKLKIKRNDIISKSSKVEKLFLELASKNPPSIVDPISTRQKISHALIYQEEVLKKQQKKIDELYDEFLFLEEQNQSHSSRWIKHSIQKEKRQKEKRTDQLKNSSIEETYEYLRNSHRTKIEIKHTSQIPQTKYEDKEQLRSNNQFKYAAPRPKRIAKDPYSHFIHFLFSDQEHKMNNDDMDTIRAGIEQMREYMLLKNENLIIKEKTTEKRKKKQPTIFKRVIYEEHEGIPTYQHYFEETNASNDLLRKNVKDYLRRNVEDHAQQLNRLDFGYDLHASSVDPMNVDQSDDDDFIELPDYLCSDNHRSMVYPSNGDNHNPMVYPRSNSSNNPKIHLKVEPKEESNSNNSYNRSERTSGIERSSQNSHSSSWEQRNSSSEVTIKSESKNSSFGEQNIASEKEHNVDPLNTSSQDKFVEEKLNPESTDQFARNALYDREEARKPEEEEEPYEYDTDEDDTEYDTDEDDIEADDKVPDMKSFGFDQIQSNIPNFPEQISDDGENNDEQEDDDANDQEQESFGEDQYSKNSQLGNDDDDDIDDNSDNDENNGGFGQNHSFADFGNVGAALNFGPLSMQGGEQPTEKQTNTWDKPNLDFSEPIPNQSFSLNLATTKDRFEEHSSDNQKDSNPILFGNFSNPDSFEGFSSDKQDSHQTFKSFSSQPSSDNQDDFFNGISSSGGFGQPISTATFGSSQRPQLTVEDTDFDQQTQGTPSFLDSSSNWGSDSTFANNKIGWGQTQNAWRTQTNDNPSGTTFLSDSFQKPRM